MKSYGDAAKQFAASSSLSKKSLQDFFDKLSAEHFERVQNAVTESLEISRLPTAVYPI